MLDKKIEKIHFDDSETHVIGVHDGEALAKCSAIVCDPSYAPDRVKATGKVSDFVLYQCAFNSKYIFSAFLMTNCESLVIGLILDHRWKGDSNGYIPDSLNQHVLRKPFFSC